MGSQVHACSRRLPRNDTIPQKEHFCDPVGLLFGERVGAVQRRVLVVLGVAVMEGPAPRLGAQAWSLQKERRWLVALPAQCHG